MSAAGSGSGTELHPSAKRAGRMFADMKTLPITALGALIALVIGLVACGGGTSPAKSTTSTNPPNSPSSVVSAVTIGDAPVDNIVSFEVTITSLQLDGKEMLSGSRRLELTHLSATVEALSIGSIAPGTHSATIAWSLPEVTFLNAAGV